MNKKKTTEEFIQEAKRIHSGEYDYSLVNYQTNKTKVRIVCPKHGVFEQTPNSHLNGSGCPCCYGTHKKTTEQFIKDAKKIHRDKYDYSLVDYKTAKTKVKIICKTCGKIFEQAPNNHLNGQDCPVCGRRKKDE